jgi:hypothetical protein
MDQNNFPGQKRKLTDQLGEKQNMMVGIFEDGDGITTTRFAWAVPDRTYALATSPD